MIKRQGGRPSKVHATLSPANLMQKEVRVNRHFYATTEPLECKPLSMLKHEFVKHKGKNLKHLFVTRNMFYPAL